MNMKNNFFVLIAMILVSSLLMVNSAYGERNCDEDMICVIPGDYVKFKNNLGSTLIEFEDEITKEQIILKWTSYKQDGSIDYISQYVLDRSLASYTSLENSEFAENDIVNPFIFVLKTPIPSAINNEEFCQQTQHNFNGKNRQVISCEMIQDNGNVKMITDTETGIVFEFDLDMGGMFSMKQELLETNIISSKDFTETKNKSPNKTKIQSKVPDWVKNNANGGQVEKLMMNHLLLEFSF